MEKRAAGQWEIYKQIVNMFFQVCLENHENCFGKSGNIFVKCQENAGKHPGKCRGKVGKGWETSLQIRRHALPQHG